MTTPGSRSTPTGPPAAGRQRHRRHRATSPAPDAAIEGSSVCRSGSTTGWHCGTIQQRDASVTYPQGTSTDLTRTSVCAEPGDSGGSFISVDQAQGVTSGGSGNCTSGGVTYFQPIREILTAYGLTLMTSDAGTPGEHGHLQRLPQHRHRHAENAQFVYQPSNRYYHTTVAGDHYGCLDSNAGVTSTSTCRSGSVPAGHRRLLRQPEPRRGAQLHRHARRLPLPGARLKRLRLLHAGLHDAVTRLTSSPAVRRTAAAAQITSGVAVRPEIAARVACGFCGLDRQRLD